MITTEKPLECEKYGYITNTSLLWFVEYGLVPHDSTTTANILEPGFIAHAKQGATEIGRHYIDKCVSYQRSL